MNRSRSFHITLAQSYWRSLLNEGDGAVDATCGNGHDTLFLAKLPLSYVAAIDIQSKALDQTNQLLNSRLISSERERVFLFHQSHKNLRDLKIPSPPRLIIYNLGYLPGGDKHLTTLTDSTLESLESALSILDQKGAISVTCYPGHEEGEKEEAAVLRFAQTLPSNDWEVRYNRWLNRKSAPSLLWISRLYNP